MKRKSLYALRTSAIVLFSVLTVSRYAQTEDPSRGAETIRGFEQADRANPPQSRGVLFTGSSSIALWKDPASYFPEYRVLNPAFGASNFSDLQYSAAPIIIPYK